MLHELVSYSTMLKLIAVLTAQWAIIIIALWLAGYRNALRHSQNGILRSGAYQMTVADHESYARRHAFCYAEHIVDRFIKTINFDF